MILWSQDPTRIVLLFAIGKQQEILVLSPKVTLLDKCISSKEYILNLASCEDENIHRLSYDKDTVVKNNLLYAKKLVKLLQTTKLAFEKI